MADLASLYVGAMFGRVVPWEVWGPSSETPEIGTKAVIEGLRQVSPMRASLSPPKIMIV